MCPAKHPSAKYIKAPTGRWQLALKSSPYTLNEIGVIKISEELGILTGVGNGVQLQKLRNILHQTNTPISDK